MKTLFAIGIAAAVAACHGQQPAAQITPTEAVTQYFAAVKARDCNALTNLSGGIVAHRLKEHGCDGILSSYTETKLELVGIQNAEVDGRDPTLTLVHATVKSASTTGGVYGSKDVIIRVSTAGGRTRVVEL